MEKPWKEFFVDHMGLIVALSGEQRFVEMAKLRKSIAVLSPEKQVEVKVCLRQRFTPSNGEDGCESAMRAVRIVAQ